MKNFLFSILNHKGKDYYLMVCVIVTSLVTKELSGNYRYIGLSLLFIECGIFVLFIIYDIIRFVNRNKKPKHDVQTINESERQREDEAVGWCTLIKTGRIGDYLKWLEKRPKEEITNRFLGIINTKDSWLPILFQEETPPEIIDGIRVDSIQNRVGRRLTKITLLLLVKDESQKLGIWDQIQPQWIEEYMQQIKAQFQIMEATAKQFEDTGQESKAADIRKNIEDLKETNKEYAIDW